MLPSSLWSLSICSLIAAARLSCSGVRSSGFMSAVNIQSWWKSSGVAQCSKPMRLNDAQRNKCPVACDGEYNSIKGLTLWVRGAYLSGLSTQWLGDARLLLFHFFFRGHQDMLPHNVIDFSGIAALRFISYLASPALALNPLLASQVVC